MRSIERGDDRAGAELLRVEGLDVYYGQAHAVQSASLTLDGGVLAVVGRNGMGKSTLCKAITGMVPARGTVQLAGRPLLGLSPDEITHLGVAYVPQGRRVWRSLTVDETLRLASTTARRGAWTVERVYQVFPRLAERRANGGAQLSGGEQQMLAIGRALLFNPRLMIMDEPTEGLAPVIVEQVATLLKALAAERTMAILLVEQNLGVALEVADRVAIMVNGRIARTLGAQALAADRELQQRLLGMRAAGDEPSEAPDEVLREGGEAVSRPTVLRLVRAHGETVAPVSEGHEDRTRTAVRPGPVASRATVEAPAALPASVQPGSIFLAGCWEQQAKELAFAKRMLERGRWRVTTVELSESHLSSAQVDQAEMLRHRTRSTAPDDQRLFADYLGSRRDVAGLMVIADGETFESGRLGALTLPTGIPKFILANGNPGLAGGDICQLNVPMAGLNRVTETLIGQAAAALTAMADERSAHPARGKPLVCITALDAVGATVRHTRAALGDAFDCLVLDMARSDADRLARLAGSGLVAGVIDLAPVDITRAVVTGQHRLLDHRFAALRDSGVPYLLVPTLLAWANFPVGQAVSGELLQRDVLTTALDGSMVPLSRTEVEQVADAVPAALSQLRSPARLMLPQPAAAGAPVAAGLPAAPLAGELLHMLARRVGGGRYLQVLERPDGLAHPRFGEAVGQAMKALLAQRADERQHHAY